MRKASCVAPLENDAQGILCGAVREIFAIASNVEKRGLRVFGLQRWQCR